MSDEKVPGCAGKCASKKCGPACCAIAGVTCPLWFPLGFAALMLCGTGLIATCGCGCACCCRPCRDDGDEWMDEKFERAAHCVTHQCCCCFIPLEFYADKS